MKRKIILSFIYVNLIFLGVLGLGCLADIPDQLPSNEETSGTQESFVCATPGDSAAPSDITITAKDAMIDLGADGTFSAWTYDGDVPGPVIRMNVGETKQVKLINDSPRPVSLHFHGVTYSVEDDGSMEHPESMVNPGCAHVYAITAEASGVWPYHSHHDPRTEISMGLFGAVVVPFPGEVPADHEFVVFLAQLGLESEEGEEEEEAEMSQAGASFFMTINGRPNGNASVIELQGDQYVMTPDIKAQAKIGQRVRWRVLNVSPDDPHTFHLHGHRWCDRGGLLDGSGNCPLGSLPADNLDLQPAQGISFEYIEDNPGEWMYHCHILDHVIDGMFGFYEVIF